MAQKSRLGVPLVYCKENVKPLHLQLDSSPTISCISLADDAVLLANTETDLSNLLFLTIQYCKKYNVELVPEKTQLIVFHRHNDLAVKTLKLTINLSLGETSLIPSECCDDLRKVLIRLLVGMVPLDGPLAIVRVDPASGFKA